MTQLTEINPNYMSQHTKSQMQCQERTKACPKAKGHKKLATFIGLVLCQAYYKRSLCKVNKKNIAIYCNVFVKTLGSNVFVNK